MCRMTRRMGRVDGAERAARRLRLVAPPAPDLGAVEDSVDIRIVRQELCLRPVPIRILVAYRVQVLVLPLPVRVRGVLRLRLVPGDVPLGAVGEAVRVGVQLNQAVCSLMEIR